jgi:hypothetical protein
MMRSWRVLLSLFLFSAVVVTAQGQQHGAAVQHDHGSGDHHEEALGTVSFPISCTPATQKPFERAVAALHSFWYEEAQKQFRNVAAADPKCAMAHWGVALSQWHQLWDRPADKTLSTGREEIRKAQSLGVSTPRERGYIAAAAAFYEPGASTDYLVRARAYSDAMRKVWQQNPRDAEAGAFYALSLLASAPPRDPEMKNRKEAVAILNKLFAGQPNHPGLAHYIIHSCDTPEMAPLALEAARRYAAIAPSSSHAVHMPSHIFARLGLWREDIASNLASVELTRKNPGGGEFDNRLHAMDFLNYAYLQTGNDDAALRLVDELDQLQGQQMQGTDHGRMRHDIDESKAEFAVIYNIEGGRYAEAAAYEPAPDASPMTQLVIYGGRVIADGYLRDGARAGADLQKFDAAIEAGRKSPEAYMFENIDAERETVQAWAAFAKRDDDNALRLMRQAAASEIRFEEGGLRPASEMLADMLLEMKRPKDALAAYEASLQRHPNRFNGLLGAARAARAAGDTTAAARYYAALMKGVEGSTSPRVEQARTEAHAIQSAAAGN